MLHLFSMGLLPERLRHQFGFEWGTSQRVSHRTLVRTLRGLLRVAPANLRRSRISVYATRRSRGELPYLDRNDRN